LARNGQPLEDPAFDVDREQALANLGITDALGADASAVYALIGQAEAAARAMHPIPPGLGRESAATATLAAFRSFPAPYEEFQTAMVGAVQAIGVAGPNTYHEDLGSDKATQKSGGMTAVSEIHTVVDAAFAGSDVKLELDTDIHTNVTDDATGAPVMTETRKATIAGELDGCPSAAGRVPGSLIVTSTEDASTFPGPGGRVGTHATGSQKRTSKFEGTSDDSATLGSVTQSFSSDEQYHRSASADGGPAAEQHGSVSFTATGIGDGVPTGDAFAPTIGDWSGATTSGTTSGTVTPGMTGRLAGSAGSDYAIMQAAYAEAQKVWRDTRCVIVTAPTYIPASSFANNNKPTHTEEVGKGSTTTFQVGLGHRFGQTVKAKFTATLDGKESLDPKQVDQAPGTMTYVAPNQDGQDGVTKYESVSRQGIGRLTLTFHTGAKKLKVSIDGTMTTSGLGVSFTTTVHAKGIVLSLLQTSPQVSPDGLTNTVTYGGGGPFTAEIRLGIADCRKPYTQKGTLNLLADHELNTVTNLDLRWFVYWDPNAAAPAKTQGACVGVPLESFTGSQGGGPVGGFMFVLGSVQLPPKGGEQRVRLTKALGPSTSTIDATVKAEIISEGK
jgi:hypothetical protein